jgi:ketose-bisphosphate aldolase
MTGTQVRELMLAARDRHVLVPAFNIAYLPMVEPVCAALAELSCFALLEVALPDISYFEAESFAAVRAEYDRWADPNLVALHLDHIPVIDEKGERVDWEPWLREGLEAGYHSAMVDGSRLSLEENIAVTHQAAEVAASYGVPLEAELGAVFGHEAGPLPPYEELLATGLGFTSPEEAVRFVTESGVDWLSVAVGNVHGALSGVAAAQPKLQARLDLGHLRRLAEATGVPLVLHGGSGISAEYLQGAAQVGVAKVNIATEIRKAYQQTLAMTGDLAETQWNVWQSVRELVTNWLGSAGSAARLGL